MRPDELLLGYPEVKDFALVLGGANCLFRDLNNLRFLRLPAPKVVIAVNDAIWRYEGTIHHAVTLHPESLKGWMDKRAPYANTDFTTWTWNKKIVGGDAHSLADRVVKHWGAGGSGLFAVTVAHDYLGFGRIVGCGVPMDRRTNLAGNQSWWEYDDALDVQRRGWQDARAWPDRSALLKRIFRSMSGWTRDLYGPPTREWLSQ